MKNRKRLLKTVGVINSSYSGYAIWRISAFVVIGKIFAFSGYIGKQ